MLVTVPSARRGSRARPAGRRVALVSKRRRTLPCARRARKSARRTTTILHVQSFGSDVDFFIKGAIFLRLISSIFLGYARRYFVRFLRILLDFFLERLLLHTQLGRWPAAEIVFAFTPNSAAAERVFS